MATAHRLQAKQKLNEKSAHTAWARITGQKNVKPHRCLRRAGERLVHGLACGQHPIVAPAVKGGPRTFLGRSHHPPCPHCGEERTTEHILLHCGATGAHLSLGGAPPDDPPRLMRAVLQDPRRLIAALLLAGDLPGTPADYMRPDPAPAPD